MTLPTRYNHQVNTSGIYFDPEEVIESLAELAGFTAYKILDENSNHEGYVLEANDKELREFLAAEDAAEQHENEIVSTMGSYLGDDIKEVSQ